MDGKTFLFPARGFSAHMTLQIQFIMTPAAQSDSSSTANSQKCTNIQNIPLFMVFFTSQAKSGLETPLSFHMSVQSRTE